MCTPSATRPRPDGSPGPDVNARSNTARKKLGYSDQDALLPRGVRQQVLEEVRHRLRARQGGDAVLRITDNGVQRGTCLRCMLPRHVGQTDSPPVASMLTGNVPIPSGIADDVRPEMPEFAFRGIGMLTGRADPCHAGGKARCYARKRPDGGESRAADDSRARSGTEQAQPGQRLGEDLFALAEREPHLELPGLRMVIEHRARDGHDARSVRQLPAELQAA
jgi:hypothetical protein